MPADLTNLLPPERRATLARDYLFRLGTLALIAFAALTIVHGILLLPSYAYIKEQQELERARLAELSKEHEASGFEELSARITAFTTQAGKLEELTKAPTASDTIRSILAASRAGIKVSSFSYTPPGGDGRGRMTVSGTAATRESLRSYDAALGALSFVSSTDLPLSAYAKESDIPFVITLALDFSP